MSKAGIRRIRKFAPGRTVYHATMARELLRNALQHAVNAGACYTAARIRAAISSAKGAVRAAEMREHRATVRNILDVQAEAEAFERGKAIGRKARP